jgi:hypothetical protein
MDRILNGSRDKAAAERSSRAPAEVSRDWEEDKVTVLAVLAAAAIVAPLGVAILKQAAQIFAP